MTPRYAILVLLAVALVALPAAVAAIRLAGTRLIGRRRTDPPYAPEELAPLGQLELLGIASGSQLDALSAHERRFLSRTVAGRLDDFTPAPAPPSRPASGPVARAATGPDREVPLSPFILVCPACGASLGTAADVAHYVGSCPACSRRVASRRRGSRVGLRTTARETRR